MMQDEYYDGSMYNQPFPVFEKRSLKPRQTPSPRYVEQNGRQNSAFNPDDYDNSPGVHQAAFYQPGKPSGGNRMEDENSEFMWHVA